MSENRLNENVFDRLRIVRRLLSPIEIMQVRRYGRSLLSWLFRTRVLLLHTTGRRSGIQRTTTVAFHRDDDGVLFIVGGAGGQTRVPDWVANLRACPSTSVTLDGCRLAVRANELSGNERQDVWNRLVMVWPRIKAYERRAGHEIPIFRLVRETKLP